MRLLFRVGKWLGTAIVVLVLSGVIVWFAGPRLLGWQPLVVLTGSMEPTLPLGSVAFTEPLPAQEVRVGDVVTFRHPDGGPDMVTHRVVEVLEGPPVSFRTKGDANEILDTWVVPAANVVGIVRHNIPYMGYVTSFVRTPLGFLLFLGLPGAIIIAGEVRNIIQEIRKGKREARAES